MIHESGTFDYEGEFSKDSFRNLDIVLNGFDRTGAKSKRLVGLNPMIRFWNERVVIVASGEHKSSIRNVSFPIGDAVNLVARPGDRLFISRTGSGGLALSLLRQQRLILAIGAIAVVPLGTEIQATRGSDDATPPAFFNAHTWLEIRASHELLRLSKREVTAAAGYSIYMERCWQHGIPGIDECVSVSAADGSSIEIAAIRSAILLGNGHLKMTNWDCTEHFNEL